MYAQINNERMAGEQIKKNSNKHSNLNTSSNKNNRNENKNIESNQNCEDNNIENVLIYS